MRFANEVFPECFEILHPKSILDLGCGKGKFFLRFLKKGSKVLGIDKQEMNISNENFEFLKQDIKEFCFKEKYDLIISSMVLHFLKHGEATEIINKIKKSTTSKGYNFLICMSKEDDYYKECKENFYVTKKYLQNLYLDWEILKNEMCFSKPHQHENGEIHKHKIIVFLAKKN